MKWKNGFLIGIILFLALLEGSACADTWTDEGNYDFSWYNTTDTEFHLDSAAQLAGLAYVVNAGTDQFVDKTIVLDSDIDLSGHNWTPIGTYEHDFEGTLDGNGHEL